MQAPVKMLVIYVDETDVWGETHTPLYEALVRRIRQFGLAGATAQAGIMGFGSHNKVHRARLFGIADDRPVVITVVDEEVKIRSILPELQSMVREGMIVLLDVEFIA